MTIRPLNILLVIGLAAGVVACGSSVSRRQATGQQTETGNGANNMNAAAKPDFLDQAFLNRVIDALVEKHGAGARDRIAVGVRQVATQWRTSDGTTEVFSSFCLEHFFTAENDLKSLLSRFEENMEQVVGHLVELERFLRTPTDVDRGEILPVDRLFARYDLSSHIVEDPFNTKVAFVVLLNFRDYTLTEKLDRGGSWSREAWAQARAAQTFTSRVPPEIYQQITAAFVAADDYINNYNIHMHHALTADGQRLFPQGLKLITHWGLRDELKAQYANPDGIQRQRLIWRIMEKIITQKIPAAVIDNPHVDWVVETGEVKKSSAKEIDPPAHPDTKAIEISTAQEPLERYRHLLSIFKAVSLADPYTPETPTYIDRKFNIHREIPEEAVIRLLTAVLSSPVIGTIAKLIEQRLDRPLEPFDIWYDGFSSRGSHQEASLDKVVSEKYPSVAAFQADLPKILGGLGFDADTAAFLSSKIVVDPSRGAGHAWGAERREDSAHLRTRIPEGGMKYKGYNIAIHELGHNVEQVFSLNRIDHTLLSGVPNTAFSEGFAFAFQGQDLALLGLQEKDPNLHHLKTLDTIWSMFEISGVAIVDIRIWQWMYAHPNATPKELKDAMLAIAGEVWNTYFAPIFNQGDQILLAVYSHIIDGGLYVPDYPIGFLVQFQMEEYFKKKGFAGEMERMCRLGYITPNAWMQAAVGGPISAEPMITAAEKAVKAMTK